MGIVDIANILLIFTGTGRHRRSFIYWLHLITTIGSVAASIVMMVVICKRDSILKDFLIFSSALALGSQVALLFCFCAWVHRNSLPSWLSSIKGWHPAWAIICQAFASGSVMFSAIMILLLDQFLLHPGVPQVGLMALDSIYFLLAAIVFACNCRYLNRRRLGRHDRFLV